MAGEDHKPTCDGCGATEGLFFFPKHGFFLCEPCARNIARILEMCQGGLTEEELKFRLKVKKGRRPRSAGPERGRSHV